jgi:hypothetical protein
MCFGGVHCCDDDDAAVEEETSLTAATTFTVANSLTAGTMHASWFMHTGSCMPVHASCCATRS